MSLKSLFDSGSNQEVSSAALEMIVNSIPTGVMVVEKTSGKIIYVNNRFIEIAGFNPIGLSFREYALNTAKVRKLNNEPFPYEQLPLSKTLFSGETTSNQEIGIQKADGSKLTILVNTRPILNDKKEITGAITFLEDATQRMKAEEDLHETERLLSAVTNASSDAIYVKDCQSRWLFANPALQRITGKKLAEVLGKTDAEIYSNPEIGRLILANDHRVMDSGKAETFEEFVDLPDGRHFFISVKAPRFDEKGKVIGLVGISHDVTPRKKREEQLRESQKKYQDLTETTSDFVWEMDSQGRYTYCSPHMEKLWGLKPAEMVGKTPFDLMPPDDRKRASEYFMEMANPPRPFSGLETTAYDSQGRLVFVETNGVPFFDEHGKLLGFRGISRDITKRKKALEQLRRAEWVARHRADELEATQAKLEQKTAEVEEYATHMEELAEERAAKLKDAERLAAIGATAGMVGHDIRNPLQTISGDVYLAMKDLIDLPQSVQKESIRESLEEIDNSVEYINKIVQDLQDYARPIRPTMKNVNLQNLCEEALFKNQMSKNIRASCKVNEDVKQIVTDPELLKRVIINLTTNALQAMPKGGKLSILAQRDKNDVVIEIQDTGMGIPENSKPKVFTPLFTTKSKGQGFGLPVVKRMTEALGGTVTFESEVDKGTRFLVRLPYRKK